MIGKIGNEPSANTFSDYLASLGVEHEVEADDTGAWLVWIVDEEKVAACRTDLERFFAEPDHADFSPARNRERKARQPKTKTKKSARVLRREDMFPALRAHRVGPLTFGIVFVCVVLAFVTEFGGNMGRAGALYIAEITRVGDQIEWYRGLREVRQGEVWRVVSPILLHGGVFHLFFNMWWFWEFAALIEARRSSLVLALLIVISAALSNLLQFWQAGPYFLGMSGVNYALFGYLWMKGRFHAGSGMGVHPHSAIILMIWFVLCLTGAVGHVANWCHAGGLVVGGLWGFFSSPGALGQVLRRG